MSRVAFEAVSNRGRSRSVILHDARAYLLAVLLVPGQSHAGGGVAAGAGARDRAGEVAAPRAAAGPADAEATAGATGAKAAAPDLGACLAADPFVLVVDPGHGPANPGAVTRFAREVDLNDRLAVELRGVLEAVPNLVVHLSRRHRQGLGPRARVARIQRLRPDLVVSLHHDSVLRSRWSRSRRAHGGRRACNDHGGFSVYIPTATAVATPSYQAALLLTRELTAIGRPIGRLYPCDTPEPGIYVGDHVYLLRKVGVPALLLEAGFVCNAREVELMNDAGERARHVAAMSRALLEFVRVTHCGMDPSDPRHFDLKRPGARLDSP